MNTAEKIIARFGGQSALARLIGKRPSTVQHWASTGIIPAKWHCVLLQIALEQSIDLSPHDFSPLEPVQSVSTVLQKPSNPEQIPAAKWSGILTLGHMEIPCYVLADGRRLISQTGATDVLTDKLGKGNLDSYIRVEALRPYMPHDLTDQMIEFTTHEGPINKTIRGMTAETFLELCQAYVKALEEGALQTPRQMAIAYKAAIFLASVAKVGLLSLIDEATGYQYERAEDALQFKLRLYLAEEMRKWERTFPDELWREFGRLTRWKGGIHQRPKYWGKLVYELVYVYLDEDVANWLKENAPKPRKGQNYHQWLTSQYGLKKLIEHIWMLIGMASAVQSLPELKQKMAEKFGHAPIQMTMYLPMQTDSRRAPASSQTLFDTSPPKLGQSGQQIS